MKPFWKQPLFIIGFSILAFFLIGSFVYEWIFGNVPRQQLYIEKNGKVIESPPISPNLLYPFGTDQLGYDQFGKLMIGGKYTILAAMAVAAFRMLIAVPLGFFMATYLKRYRPFLTGLFDAVHYIPMTIFAYIALMPVLWMPQDGFSNSLLERIIIEVVILAMLTVPIVASLIGNEAAILYEKEYILASRTLGASKFRIIRKHLFPQLREKLFVLYGQQIVETLIVFAHLGLLDLFLGGTKVNYSPMFGDPPMSISFEWAGLFGSTFGYLQGAPWLPLGPAICFALVILSIAAMIEGYSRASVVTKSLDRKLSNRKDIPEDVIAWNQQQLKEKMILLKEKTR